MVDPTDPQGRMLTELIGFGPFKYHYGGWDPGTSVRIENNPNYFAGHICQADIDFTQRVDTNDLIYILMSIGVYSSPNYRVEADIHYPAQRIWGPEIAVFLDHFGNYWGPDPVPAGYVRCPGPTG